MSSEADRLLDELDHLPAPPAVPILKDGLRYSHAAMMDLLMAQPWLQQNDLARIFRRTPSWISTVMHSDAWKAGWAARIEKIVDPALRFTLEENTRGLYARSLEILQQKLNTDAANVPDQLAVQVFAQTARALGYGARQEAKVEVNIVNQIEKHGDNLVTLLRRTKETIDGEVERSRPGNDQQPEGACSTEVGEVPRDVQPALRGPEPGRADAGGPGSETV